MVKVIVIACVKIEKSLQNAQRRERKTKRCRSNTTDSEKLMKKPAVPAGGRHVWRGMLQFMAYRTTSTQIVGGDGGFNWKSTCRFQVRRFGCGAVVWTWRLEQQHPNFSAVPHRMFLRSIRCSASRLHLNWRWNKTALTCKRCYTWRKCYSFLPHSPTSKKHDSFVNHKVQQMQTFF